MKKRNDIHELAQRVIAGEANRTLAKQYGIPEKTLRDHVKYIRESEEKKGHYKTAGFDFPTMPEEERSVEEIIEMRKAVWKRKKAYDDAHKVVDITIQTSGPIAISTFGDPHLDDRQSRRANRFAARQARFADQPAQRAAHGQADPDAR